MDKITESKICVEYKFGMMTPLSEKYEVSRAAIYRALKRNAIPTTKKTHIYKEDVFDLIDTELKAYVLGLITSDGYIANKNGRYVVQLSSTDKEIPSFFAQLIEYPRPLYHIKSEDVAKRTLDEWRIMVCSKRLVLALEKLGVVNGKSMKEVFCSSVPDNLIRHYIRGIFDGDGHLTVAKGYKDKFQGQIGVCGSLEMLTAISKKISQNLGARYREPRSTNKSNDLYGLAYFGNLIAKSVTTWLYSDCNYAMSRKLVKAQQIMSLQATRKVSVYHQDLL